MIASRVLVFLAATLLLMGASVSVLLPSNAAAQAQGTIDEVVVTATRRDTVLRDAPVTVDVFTADDVERSRITRPADFLGQVANVNLTTAVRPGESNVSMRGIQGNFGLAQPVALVVDGVVAANQNALDQELVGIQQIEVVKGPQSALYGRNANAGAIVINTKRPTQDTEVKVLAGGGNGGLVRAQALVSGSLGSEKLAGRLALSHSETDGFWDNKTLGRPVDILQQQVVDARVIYDATENLSIDLRAKASDLKMGSGLWDVQVPPFQAFDNNNFFPEFQMNNAPPGHQVRYDFSLKTDYQLPFGTLVGIVSYDDYDTNYFSDGAFHTISVGGPPTVFVNPMLLTSANPPLYPGYSYSTADGMAYAELNQIDKTFELRLTSASDQRLRWFVGAYYSKSRRLFYQDTRADRGAGFIEEQLGGALDPTGRNPIITLQQYYIDRAEDTAGFGQLQFDLTDQWMFEVSLRYDEEKRENLNLIPNILSPTTGRPLANQAINPFGLLREATFSEWQPKYTVRFKPTDHVTLFASVGRGFRSGGFNGAGSGAAVQAQAPLTNFQDAFPAELSDAYELGIKSDWFDRRLTLNASAFYTEIENAQAFTAFPAPPIQLVISLEEVEAKGFEVDLSWRINDQLRISDSFGLTDTEITKTALASALGNQVPSTPDYTNNLSLSYNQPLTSGMTLQTQVDWKLTGPMWFDVYETPNTEREEFSLVNARVALENSRGDGSWQVALWASNLFDKHWNIYSAPVPPIANFSYRAAPRSYGVDLSYRF